MEQEKGEIQKRLEQNRCPWCTHALRLASEEYKNGKRVITRKCTQCRGTVIDEFSFGEQHGNDTRSEGEEESHQHTERT